MQAVVLCGIQASGKTSFFRDRFSDTHVRISRDLLRTEHRERRFLELCLETGQPFVVDKTNATPGHRRPYVESARAAEFRVIAYVLDVSPSEAIARNARRDPRRRVPDRAVLGTRKALVAPTRDEGFDEIFSVRADGTGGWVVEPAPAG
jgi:predicted kinase